MFRLREVIFGITLEHFKGTYTYCTYWRRISIFTQYSDTSANECSS